MPKRVFLLLAIGLFGTALGVILAGPDKTGAEHDSLERGLVAYHAGRYADAIGLWKPILGSGKEDGILLYRYAYALDQTNGPPKEIKSLRQQAKSALEKALKTSGGPAECFYLSVLLEERKERQAATLREGCFARFQDQRNSGNPDTLYFLAQLASDTDEGRAQAEPLLERALDLYAGKQEFSGFEVNTVDSLGELQRDAGRLTESLATYDRGLRRHTDEADLLSGRAETYWELERYADAEKDWRAFVRLVPDKGAAYTRLGLCLWAQNRSEEALEAFRAAEQKGDTSGNRLNGLGLALWNLSKLDEAAAAFRKAIHQEPEWSRLHHNLAGVLLDLNDPSAAEKEAREAVRLEGGEWDYRERLGEILSKKGDREAALQVYRQAAAGGISPAEALAGEGKLLLDFGRPEDALNPLREALSRKPDTALWHRYLGSALETLKKHDEAEASYRQAIRLDPENAVHHGFLASLLDDTGRREAALEEYRKAEAIDPDYAFAVEQASIILEGTKGSDQALEYLSSRLERFKTNAPILRRAGIAHHDLRHFSEAEALLRAAVQANPHYEYGYDSLAIVLHDQPDPKKQEEAREVLRRGLTQIPDSVQLRFRLGAFLDDAGRPAEGETWLRQVLDKSPQFATAWNSLGATLEHQGKTEEAISGFRKALQLRPDFDLAESNLVLALKKAGRKDEALEALRHWAGRKPKDPEPALRLAEALTEEGKPEEAEKTLSQAVTLGAGSMAALKVRIGILLAKKQDEDALSLLRDAESSAENDDYAFRKAAEILHRAQNYVAESDVLDRFLLRFPRSALAARQKGIVLNRIGRYDDAVGAFRLATEIDPGNWLGWAGMGDAHFNAGEYQKALEIYQKARSLSPDAWSVRIAIGDALSRLNRADEAIAAYDEVLKARPEDVDCRLKLANALRAQKRYAEAEALLLDPLSARGAKEAVKPMPKDKIRSIRLALSEIYEAAAQPGRAARALEPLVADNPADLTVHRALARALRGEGKLQESVRELETVLNADPEDPEALAMLKSFPKDVTDAAAFLRRIRPAALDFDPVPPALTFTSLKTEDPSLTPLLENQGLVVLNDQFQIDVRPGGLLTETRYQLLRPMARAEAEALGEYRISYKPSREQLEVHFARTILPDGTTLDAGEQAFHRVSPSDTSTGNVYSDDQILVISLPQVREGVAIEIQYTKKTKSTITESQWWSSRRFQAYSPFLHARLAVRTALNDSLSYDRLGSVPTPETEQVGDHRIYRWSMANVPGLKQEEHDPPLDARAASVFVSSYKSWDEVAGWLRRLFQNQYVLSSEAKATVARLTEGTQDPVEKTRRIYNHLIESVRYVAVELGISSYEPRVAAETYRNRYGDCKDRGVLLIALLKEAGIRASPALVRTRDEGPLFRNAPAPGQFNHLIVYVPEASLRGREKGLWLDATAEHAEMGSLPPSDQGVDAFLFEEAKSRFLTTPIAISGENHRILKRSVAIHADGSAHVTDDAIATGYLAQQFRGALSRYDEQERKQLVDQSVQGEFPSAYDIDYSFTGIDDFAEPPRDLEHYRVGGFVKSTGKTWIIPMRVLDSIEHTLPVSSVTDRTSDYVADVPLVLEEETKITLPAGRTFTEWPGPLQLDSTHAFFTLTCARDGQTITLKSRFVLKDRVVPLSDYKAFATLVQKAIDAGRLTLLAK
jgi:tetratricopeptide (TPR) repeat protein